MKTRRVLLLIPVFLAFVFALILRWQWQNASPPEQPISPNRIDSPRLRWRAASEAERRAAIATIRAQLEAFRADDYKTAIKYQSKEMQQQFASMETFRDMMKRAYPQFAAPKSYTFGPSRATSNATFITVPVILKGADGVTVNAEYLMKKESSGYRVSGVQGGTVRPKMPPSSPAPRKPGMTI